MKGFKRMRARPQRQYVDRGPKVVDMSPESALRFFGYDPATHEAVDVGPPADPDRWRKGARVYECRKKLSAMN